MPKRLHCYSGALQHLNAEGQPIDFEVPARLVGKSRVLDAVSNPALSASLVLEAALSAVHGHRDAMDRIRSRHLNLPKSLDLLYFVRDFHYINHGPRIAVARSMHGLTAEELADLIGVSRPLISQYEEGLYEAGMYYNSTSHSKAPRRISDIHLMNISHYINVPAAWLVESDPIMNGEPTWLLPFFEANNLLRTNNLCEKLGIW